MNMNEITHILIKKTLLFMYIKGHDFEKITKLKNCMVVS